jgi:hypothetical protein
MAVFGTHPYKPSSGLARGFPDSHRRREDRRLGSRVSTERERPARHAAGARRLDHRPRPGASDDGARIAVEGTPPVLVARRATLTGEPPAAYVGT